MSIMPSRCRETATSPKQWGRKFFKNKYGQSVWALEERETKRVRRVKEIKTLAWRILKKHQTFSNYRRVWSWLRLNAGGRPNTCKSNGNWREACFFCRRVADGWVRSGKLPDRGGQQLETVANTAYTLRGKVARRCQMCPEGISWLVR